MEATYKIFTSRGDRTVKIEDIPLLLANMEIRPDTRIFNNETKTWVDFKDYKHLHGILSTLSSIQSGAKDSDRLLDGKPYQGVNDNRTKLPQQNQARSEYLQECLNCHHQYSKRADKCPKCGNVVHMECNICKRKIPKNSTSCPECGDPEPFVTVKVKVEEVARPKEVRRDNTNSDASSKAGNQADTHQRTAALSPLQVLFSFRGRITRQQFWLYSIPAQSLGVVWYVLLEIFKEYNRQVLYGGTGPSGVTATILFLSVIPIGWMCLAVSLKRLHDRDKSFMWIFLFSVPIIGTVWWLVELGFLKGTEGRNQYGEDPLSQTVTISTYQKGSIQTEVNGNYKRVSQEGSPTLGLKQEDKRNNRAQVDSQVFDPSNKQEVSENPASSSASSEVNYDNVTYASWGCLSFVLLFFVIILISSIFIR